MKLSRKLAIGLSLALLLSTAVVAQQVRQNAYPIGRGSGTGFNAVGPCAIGEVPTGTGGMPVCSPLPNINVDTIAALEAYGSVPPNGQVFYVRGYSAQGDGGQGHFQWVTGDSTTLDPCRVHARTGSPTGRFFRHIPVPDQVESAWCGDVASRTAVQQQTAIQAALDTYTRINLRPGVTYQTTTVATTYGASNRAVFQIKKSNTYLDCRNSTIKKADSDFSGGAPVNEVRQIIYAKHPTNATFIENISLIDCHIDGNAAGGTSETISTLDPGLIQDNGIHLSYVRNWFVLRGSASNAAGSGFSAAASDGGALEDYVANFNGKNGVYLSDSGAGDAATNRKVTIRNLRTEGNNHNFGQTNGSYYSAVPTPCAAGKTKCNYSGLAFTPDHVFVDGYWSKDEGSGLVIISVGSILDPQRESSITNCRIENPGGIGIDISSQAATELTSTLGGQANYNKNITISNCTIRESGSTGVKLSGVRKASLSNLNIIDSTAGGFQLDQGFGSQTATITGITKANPAVVTAAGHGYSSGERVLFSGVVGMVEINNLAGVVTVIDPNSFSVNIDTSGGGFTAYASGGSTFPIILSTDITATNIVVTGSDTAGVVLRSTQNVSLSNFVVTNSGTWGLQTVSNGQGTASNTDLTLGPMRFNGNVSGTVDLSAASSVANFATGTSGGVPYWASATNLASSAVLNSLVIGQGAGLPPSNYGGTNCTNQFFFSLSAVGAAGCASVNLATHVTGILGPANGGTGIANNAASTLTMSGNFATTLTRTGVTNVTLPTTGTLATLAGSETFTNKTLTSPTINTGNIASSAITGGNIANTEVRRLQGGTGGSPPTMGACGGSPAVNGSDMAGIITIGSAPGTTCVMNFSSSWGTSFPICVASVFTAAITAKQTSSSLTSVTFTGSATFTAGDFILYHCIGRAN